MPDQHGGQPLVVERSRLRAEALWAAAATAVAAGAGHVGWGRLGGRPGEAAAFAVLLAGGAGLGLLGSRSGAAHPALVLTRSALHDHASGAAVGELRWDEVIAVRTRELPGSQIIQLQVVDPDVLLARLSPVRRVIVRMNLGLLGAPVNLPVAACAIGARELTSLIESRVAAARMRS